MPPQKNSCQNCLHNRSEQWNSGRRRAPLRGWMHSQLKTTALSCTKGTSEIHYACDMAGSPRTFPAGVHVMHPSPWNMHSAVPQEAFPHWGTMRSETSRPTSWPKCAMMSALSLNSRSCQGRHCISPPLSETMEPVLTFGHKGSGATGHDGHSSTWGYSIPMHRPTGNSNWTQSTVVMRRRSEDPTSSASER